MPRVVGDYKTVILETFLTYLNMQSYMGVSTAYTIITHFYSYILKIMISTFYFPGY